VCGGGGRLEYHKYTTNLLGFAAQPRSAVRSQMPYLVRPKSKQRRPARISLSLANPRLVTHDTLVDFAKPLGSWAWSWAFTCRCRGRSGASSNSERLPPARLKEISGGPAHYFVTSLIRRTIFSRFIHQPSTWLPRGDLGRFRNHLSNLNEF
jgi:hypothetical protein